RGGAVTLDLRCRTGCAGGQVVPGGTGQQSLGAAEVGGRLDRVHHQVPAGDLARRDAGGLAEERDEVTVAHVVAQAPHGLQVPLLVQLEPVAVDGPVQVDGELRDAQQGPVDVDQAGGAVAQGQPSGEAQVPVEPGVEQRA